MFFDDLLTVLVDEVLERAGCFSLVLAAITERIDFDVHLFHFLVNFLELGEACANIVDHLNCLRVGI
jgi:hypothetical protein